MTVILKPSRLARLSATLPAVGLAFALMSGSAVAQKKYDTGATDTEIKIGNTAPHSGPASAYGVNTKTEQAYFNMINAQGGINGRKINFIAYDDAYSPPKAVEQTRKLIEGDEVLLIFNPIGTPANKAVQGYLNGKGVPQLFVGSGASIFADPEHFPWTMGWQGPLQVEGRVYAKYLLQNKPDAKIAIFYQNDDFGKDILKAFKDGLGAKGASMIVAEESYELSEPTIEPHITRLKASGADTLVDLITAKAAVQAIKQIAALQWNVLHILNNAGSQITATIEPAGFDISQGIISANYIMDPTDPQWNDTPGMKEWAAFMDKWNPDGDKKNWFNTLAYAISLTLVQVLKQSGDDLTRANIMKQAANLRDFDPGVLLPGIKINTSPTQWRPVHQMKLMRVKGKTWELFGPVLSGD